MTEKQLLSLLRRLRLALMPLLQEQPPEIAAMIGSDNVNRSMLARDLHKLEAWCSPQQKAALDSVTEMTGIYLDDHLTSQAANHYVAVLERMYAGDDADAVPL